MAEMTTWMGAALDVAVLVLLGVALWRLGGDRAAAWEAREMGMREAVEGLRGLVAEAERQATSLDQRLAAHADDLRGLLAAARPAVRDGESAALGARVRELVARATPVEEIARRLDVPLAEARLLVALETAARTGAGAGKKVAASSAA